MFFCFPSETTTCPQASNHCVFMSKKCHKSIHWWESSHRNSDMFPVCIYIYTKDIRYFQLLVKKFRPLYKPLRKKQEAVSFLSKPPVFTSVLAGLGIARIGTLFGGEEHPIIGMLRVPRHGASQGPVIGCQPWMNKPRLRLFFIGKVPFNLSIRWNDSWGNIPLIFINYGLAKSGVDINWIYHIEFMKPNDFLSRVDEIIGG